MIILEEDHMGVKLNSVLAQGFGDLIKVFEKILGLMIEAGVPVLYQNLFSGLELREMDNDLWLIFWVLYLLFLNVVLDDVSTSFRDQYGNDVDLLFSLKVIIEMHIFDINIMFMDNYQKLDSSCLCIVSLDISKTICLVDNENGRHHCTCLIFITGL